MKGSPELKVSFDIVSCNRSCEIYGEVKRATGDLKTSESSMYDESVLSLMSHVKKSARQGKSHFFATNSEKKNFKC